MTDSFADRWARRFLYALIVLQAVPFFGIPTGLDWPGFRRFNFYKLIVVVLILGLLSARLDRVRMALRNRTRLVALCAALAIWVGLFLGSIAYQSGLRSNLEIFLLYWTPSLLVFAYLLLVYPSSRRRALILSLAGFYVLALALGYLEWLTWKKPMFDALFVQFKELPHSFLPGGTLRVGGSLGVSGLAEALLIGVPLVMGLGLDSFRNRKWTVFILSSIAFSAGIPLLLGTFLRHVGIVLLVDFFIFVSFLFPTKSGRKLILATVGISLLVLAMGVGILAIQGHTHLILARYLNIDVQSPSDSTTDDKATQAVALQASRSISARMIAYKTSWAIFRDRPWTGIGMGPEEFDRQWRSRAPEWWRENHNSPVTHAHNFYVQMFVSGGLLAGLGFSCLVLLIVRKSWQAWKMGRVTGVLLLSPLEIGVLTAVAGIFVSMLFDFKYNLQWSTLILWVLLGTVILILDNPDEQDSSHAAISEKLVETARES